MDDDRTPLITRSTLLAGAAALLAGCTGKRRTTSPSSSPAASTSNAPTAQPGATSPVASATGSAAPTPSPPLTPSPTPTASPSAAVSPAPRGDEAAVLAAALTREQSLLAAYDKALRRLPALAPTLQALRAHHQAHADRLGGKAGRPPAGPGRAIVPPRRTSATAAVLGTLTDAELGAARAGVSAVGAASPAVGVLLAEIAGSEEQHAVLLRWLSGADR